MAMVASMVRSKMPTEPWILRDCTATNERGVTLFDGADGGPTPTPLVAVTVKVYAVPLVSPLTMIGPPVAKP